MYILGIETSCDDTSIAILRAEDGSFEMVTNVVSSQIKLHAAWGGVVPQLAAREHANHIDQVLRAGLSQANLTMEQIDLIAVTSGPGLIMSLIVGTTFAKALAYRWNKPIIGVNHIEGHIYSNWLPSIREFKNSNLKFKIESNIFPALCLIVSGGHTELVLMTNHGEYQLVGKTVDDAAGEAFDKIARLLGLEYPGGPAIARQALTGHPTAFPLPRPMLTSKNYNFSFSGLKTAVLYLVRDLKQHDPELSQKTITDIAASAQEAIVDVLATKTIRAAIEYNVKSILLAGGVSANKALRERLAQKAQSIGITAYIPDLAYTTDNAAMIAIAGYHNWLRMSEKEKSANTHWRSIKPDANWEIV